MTFWTRKYLARILLIEQYVRNRAPTGGLVADIACAQGNIAIRLAEGGCRTVGLDLRENFLRYARKKDEHRVGGWVVGNALFPPFRPGAFDAVVLGEILEHVAEPRLLLTRSFALIKDGGILVATTPNGACLRFRHQPSYRTAARNLQALRARQFGPAGKDHLFALRPEEIRAMLPEAKRWRVRFVGCTLWNRAIGWLARWHAAAWLVEMIGRFPLWRRWLCETVVVVVHCDPPAG